MQASTKLQHPYSALIPDRVLDAVEEFGFQPDGRVYPLNSYENRVYQVGVIDGPTLVVKFYRPARWSRDQILEEHRFASQLAALELPVIAPIEFPGVGSLRDFDGFTVAVFEQFLGRPPEFDKLDNLLVMGRFVGRIHAVGITEPFQSRRHFSVATFAEESSQFLLEADFIPVDLIPAYESLSRDLIDRLKQAFTARHEQNYLRIHGDCHSGNVLWQGDTPYFVDFDDSLMGPAMQDLWMLLSGSRDQRQAQLLELVEGYNEFHDFRVNELELVESLRTLRLMHYSAWLARRWEDPAFPHNFPWFNTPRYWSEHILELREQWAALDEPPLELIN